MIVIALSGRAPGEGVVLRHLLTAPRSLDLLQQPHDSLVLQMVDGAGVLTLIAFTPEPGARTV